MKKIIIFLLAANLKLAAVAQLQTMNRVETNRTQQVPVNIVVPQKFVPEMLENKMVAVDNSETKNILNIEKLRAIETDRKQNLLRIGDLNAGIKENNTLLTSIKKETSEKGKMLDDAIKSLKKDSTMLKSSVLKNDEEKETLKQKMEDQRSAIQIMTEEKKALIERKRDLELLVKKNREAINMLNNVNKDLNEQNRNLTITIAINNTQIAELLKTKKEYTILKYKTDSTLLNNFYIELKKKLSDIKKGLILNSDSLKSNKYFTADFDADSTNMNGATNDLITISNAATSIKKELEINIESLYKNTDEQLRLFNKCGEDLSENIHPISTIDSIIKARQKALLTSKDLLENRQLSFTKSYDVYLEIFKKANDHLQTIVVKKIEKKKTESADALLGVSSPLNQNGLLVPEFNLLAYNKFTDSNLAIFGQARFIIASPQADSNKLNNGTRLFVPETSSLGFLVDFTFGFDKATYRPVNSSTSKSYHTLGINVGFYYLQKSLTTPDAAKTNFSVGLLQTKIGIEKTLVRNGLAFFANLNGIYVGKGTETYSKHFDSSEKMQWFSEFGLKSYLVLSKDDKTKINFELRFLPVNSIIRTTTGTTDKFIPLIKVSFARSFSF